MSELPITFMPGLFFPEITFLINLTFVKEDTNRFF